MRLLVHVQEWRCGEGQHPAWTHRPLTPVSLCKVPHGAKGPWGQSLSSVLSRSGPVPLLLSLLCSLKEGAAVPGAAGTLAPGGWNGDWRKRGAESPVWKSTEGQGSIEARESQDLGPRRQPRTPAPLHGHQHWRPAADQVWTRAGPLGRSHLTDRETEVQRGRITCSQVLRQDQNPWGHCLSPPEAPTCGEAGPTSQRPPCQHPASPARLSAPF